MFRYSHFLGWIVFFLMSALVFPQVPTNWAVIEGRVLDFENHPLPGARISIFPMDVAFSGGLPSATTDRDGKYRLSSPPFVGRTRLCAVKESQGYPDTQDLLFVSGKESMPEVNLTPGSHLYDVNIHLGPPNGIVEGSVIDAASGSSVAKARITLHRNTPESMYSTSIPDDGHFVFALPPAPIEITVTAPGYAPWKYRDPSGANALMIAESAHKIITVDLKAR